MNSEHNVNYEFSATLEESSWEEIKKISVSGQASQIFSVGDTKNVTCKSVVVEGTYPHTSYAVDAEKSCSARLVHMASNSMFFALPTEICEQITFSEDGAWNSNTFRSFLNTNAQGILQDIYTYTKNVSHNTETTADKSTESHTVNTSDRLFPLSKDEINGGFSYFSSNSRRAVFEKTYITRTTYRGYRVWSSSGDIFYENAICYAGVFYNYNGHSNGEISYDPQPKVSGYHRGDPGDFLCGYSITHRLYACPLVFCI